MEQKLCWNKLNIACSAHPLTKVLPDLRLQEVDKLRLHELIVIGDAEADDALAAKLRAEVVGELALVLLLHNEDDLGPLDQFGRQRVVCAAVGAGRGRFETWSVGEHLLGSRTAEAVLAADEEEVQSWTSTKVLRTLPKLLRRRMRSAAKPGHVQSV